MAATRANARMRLRVLGTLFGDSRYNRAPREEARFREAEWDNYLATALEATRNITTRIRALHLRRCSA